MVVHLGHKLTIRVPASTANLGSGFDSIGLALQLYMTIHVEPAEETQFIWKGKELQNVTISDQDNLILKAMERVYTLCKQTRPPLRIEVESDIPLTRGLGSSASAFIGGLVLANELLHKPLTDDDLLWLATEEEGHPDNVGASLFGGVFVASVDWQQKKVYYHSQQFPDTFKWIVAIPSYPLSTAVARNILPNQYSKEDAIFNLSRFGLLIASLLTGNRTGLAVGLEDALHQPYREQLIPGFSALLEKKEELGVLGFVISGAGPTILALTDRAADDTLVRKEMERFLTVPNHPVEVRCLEVDQYGYQIETKEIDSRSEASCQRRLPI